MGLWADDAAVGWSPSLNFESGSISDYYASGNLSMSTIDCLRWLTVIVEPVCASVRLGLKHVNCSAVPHKMIIFLNGTNILED
jgi:hypothetical protein